MRLADIIKRSFKRFGASLDNAAVWTTLSARAGARGARLHSPMAFRDLGYNRGSLHLPKWKAGFSLLNIREVYLSYLWCNLPALAEKDLMSWAPVSGIPGQSVKLVYYY